MKNVYKMACTALLILVILPVGASAAGINPGFSFTGPVSLSGKAGTTVYFIGTLKNSTADIISLDGISFSFSNTANFTGIDAPFYSGQATLSAGESHTANIFGVQIAANTPVGTYTSNTANIANTDTVTNVSFINPIGFTDTSSSFNSQPFTVTVTASPAPEPSGIVIWVIGVLGLAVLARRRQQVPIAVPLRLGR